MTSASHDWKVFGRGFGFCQLLELLELGETAVDNRPLGAEEVLRLVLGNGADIRSTSVAGRRATARDRPVLRVLPRDRATRDELIGRRPSQRFWARPSLSVAAAEVARVHVPCVR